MTAVMSLRVQVLCSMAGPFLALLAGAMQMSILPHWLHWCSEQPGLTGNNDSLPSYNGTLSEDLPRGHHNTSTLCKAAAFEPASGIIPSLGSLIELFLAPAFSVYVSDKLHTEFLVVLGLLISNAYFIALAFGSGYGMLLVAEINGTVYNVVTEIAYLVNIDHIFREDEQAHRSYTGLLTFIIDLDVFGPVYVGVLLQYFGQAVPFLSLSVISFITLLTYITFGLGCKMSVFPDHTDKPDSQEDVQDPHERQNLHKYPDTKKTNANNSRQSHNISMLFSNHYVLSVSFLVILVGMPSQLMGPTISLWIMSRYDTDVLTVGLVYLPGFIAVFGLTIIVHKVISKWQESRYPVAFTLLLLDGASLIAFRYSPSVTIFAAIYAVQMSSASCLRFILLPIIAIIVNKRYGIRDSKIVRGWIYALVVIPYIAGPIIGSLLFKSSGFIVITVIGIIHILTTPTVYYLTSLNEESKTGYKLITNTITEPEIETYIAQISYPID